MNDKLEKRQKNNHKIWQKQLDKQHSNNFYAIDTETSGFDTNEPIQIAAVLFVDG